MFINNKKFEYIKSFIMVLIIFAVMFPMTGCSETEDDGLYAYPCYYNADVEGMNASVAVEKLKENGFTVKTGEIAEDQNTVYVILPADNETPPATVLKVYETTELAKEAYAQEYQIAATIINDYPTVRISDFTLRGSGKAIQEILTVLGMLKDQEKISISGTVQVQTVQQAQQDFLAVAERMEADGYAVYTSSTEELDVYTIISQNGTRQFLLITLKGSATAEETAKVWADERNTIADSTLRISTYTVIGNRQLICAIGDTFCELEGYLK